MHKELYQKLVTAGSFRVKKGKAKSNQPGVLFNNTGTLHSRGQPGGNHDHHHGHGDHERRRSHDHSQDANDNHGDHGEEGEGPHRRGSKAEHGHPHRHGSHDPADATDGPHRHSAKSDHGHGGSNRHQGGGRGSNKVYVAEE